MKTLEQAEQFIKDNNVKYVLAQFVDIHGVAKVKSVPSAHLKDIIKTGAGFAGGAICGMGIQPNGPDYMAMGDLSTLSLIPWQPGYARVICNGHVKVGRCLPVLSLNFRYSKKMSMAIFIRLKIATHYKNLATTIKGLRVRVSSWKN